MKDKKCFRCRAKVKIELIGKYNKVVLFESRCSNCGYYYIFRKEKNKDFLRTHNLQFVPNVITKGV